VSEAPPGIRPAAPANPAPDPGQLRPGERGGPGRLSGPPPGNGAGEPPRNGTGELDAPGERRGPAQEPRAPGPQRATAGPDSQEEHYFPPPPPPLPKLDPLSKGAWVALFGGPAYLLIATAVGWTVPAVAAFFAIGAFVGGFAVLVLRMGDEPRNGSGPDDGAVV
jgi:hypothetical protein